MSLVTKTMPVDTENQFEIFGKIYFYSDLHGNIANRTSEVENEKLNIFGLDYRVQNASIALCENAKALA